MKAIHDRHYATPPADWEEYRWRLQLLAEERVGSGMRDAARAEDAAFGRAMGALG